MVGEGASGFRVSFLSARSAGIQMPDVQKLRVISGDHTATERQEKFHGPEHPRPRHRGCGRPGCGHGRGLHATDGETATLVKRAVLNHDGRTDALFDNAEPACWQLPRRLDARYFKARGGSCPSPP